MNGPEFQVTDATRLIGASWTISNDQSVIDDIWVARRELPTYSLAVLGLSLHRREEDERAKVTVEEARARIQAEFRFLSERNTRDLDAPHMTILRTRVALGLLTPDTMAARDFARWPVEVIETVANSFAESHGLPELMAIRKACYVCSTGAAYRRGGDQGGSYRGCKIDCVGGSTAIFQQVR